MEPITVREIAEAVGGKLLGAFDDLDRTVTHVFTDSREPDPGALFIPLVGERFDGHAFIHDALTGGAAGCFTQRERETYLPGKFYIKVSSTQKALRDLARHYKQKFKIPFVGVTGSVGKTTTKDMVAAVLGEKFKVLKTEGNFNNEVGLPLTLLRLNRQHELCVLEMGMNHFGEIEYLSGIVEPTSIKIAGDQFDEAIVKYIRRKHNVLIGERTAEELKMQIGCVFPRPEEQTVEIKGRCLMTGLPRVFSVSSSEMIEAFEEVSTRILEAIHGVLERTPPELVADISTNGIVMTGGGSLVWGFDKLIESHTGIETHVADDAISCVAYGTGKSLEWVGDMADGTLNISRRKQMN